MTRFVTWFSLVISIFAIIISIASYGSIDKKILSFINQLQDNISSIQEKNNENTAKSKVITESNLKLLTLLDATAKKENPTDIKKQANEIRNIINDTFRNNEGTEKDKLNDINKEFDTLNSQLTLKDPAAEETIGSIIMKLRQLNNHT
jgi:hypothetical protein